MEPIVPMEPKSSVHIEDDQSWLAQVKWDGTRVLTYYDGNEVQLFNRKKRDRTAHYPELTPIKKYCEAQSVILDGEIIALDEEGKPSFHQVMRRDGIRRMERIQTVQKVVPVTYMIFDVLYYNGEWINRRPLTERMEILANIITPSEQIQLVTSHEDGESLFTAIKEHGMEGIVVKRKDSPHLLGAKTDHWLKIKNYRDLIAVVGGFTLNGEHVNAILLGLYDEQGKLWYIGHSGTAKMSKAEWKDETEKLRRLQIKEKPFENTPDRHKEAVWVTPKITVKIKYAEWKVGRSLRQPSIQSFVDVDPAECVFNEDMMK